MICRNSGVDNAAGQKGEKRTAQQVNGASYIIYRSKGGAAAFQRVIGESKEAATRLLPQSKAAQERCPEGCKAADERIAPHKSFASAAERCVRTRRPAASIPPAERRRFKGSRRIHGGPRGKSQSPWPSLAAGGCHAAAPTSNSGARMRRESRTATLERRATRKPSAPAAERCVRTRRPAASSPSGAAAFQGVIGESKEGLGGNRNPPGPPWPPEAATRLRQQVTVAQGCAAKAATQQKNALPRKTLCHDSRALR